MGFPEDALAPHEKLVLNLHPHPWVLAQPVALLVVALGAGIAADRTPPPTAFVAGHQ